MTLIGGLRLDMWVALGGGYLMDRYPQIEQKLTPSIECTKKAEGLLLKLYEKKTIGKFTSFNEAGGISSTTSGGETVDTSQQAPARNINPFSGRGVTLGADNTTGMFAQQQAYDEIQKQHTDANIREKAREEAIKRDKEAKAKKETEGVNIAKKDFEDPIPISFINNDSDEFELGNTDILDTATAENSVVSIQDKPTTNENGTKSDDDDNGDGLLI